RRSASRPARGGRRGPLTWGNRQGETAIIRSQTRGRQCAWMEHMPTHPDTARRTPLTEDGGRHLHAVATVALGHVQGLVGTLHGRRRGVLAIAARGHADA